MEEWWSTEVDEYIGLYFGISGQVTAGYHQITGTMVAKKPESGH